MPRKQVDPENERIHQQLNASFTLAGYLLEAQEEGAAILATMRAGNDLLDAEGCAFVPFSEWKQSLPALKYGGAAFLRDKNWLARLSAPATRHTCRICESKQAGPECVLLHDTAAVENIYCVVLRCSGQEVGMINYFFSKLPQMDESQHLFLAEMVRLTDLTLDALRVHEQEVESIRRAFSPVDLKKNLIGLNEKNVELLEQLENKAVLDERTRLAREIHDGLAQTLAFLKIETARMQSYVSKGEMDAVTRTLQACHQTLSDAYLDARQVIDNLRHVPDETLGDWLQMTAADFETLSGMKVDVSNVQLSYEFPSNAKAQLTRIVQEALTNIRKHAQSCTVRISAVEREGEAVIEIRDDGIGFSPEEARSASKYGLHSMRERAEIIDAEFQIVSAPGVGTTVRLQIPLRDKVGL